MDSNRKFRTVVLVVLFCLCVGTNQFVHAEITEEGAPTALAVSLGGDARIHLNRPYNYLFFMIWIGISVVAMFGLLITFARSKPVSDLASRLALRFNLSAGNLPNYVLSFVILTVISNVVQIAVLLIYRGFSAWM